MGKTDRVWARVGLGRVRLMSRQQAEENGYEIDKRPGLGIGAGTRVKKLFMHSDEKKKAFLSTGVHVEDEDELNRVMKSKDLRDAEKGELAYERFDALRECAETGKPMDPKFAVDLYGDVARADERAKTFSMRERYQYHEARQREMGLIP